MDGTQVKGGKDEFDAKAGLRDGLGARMRAAAFGGAGRGHAPGFHARTLLLYGSGWRLYDAGCLTWNYQQHAWYSHCGLPQNAPLYQAPVVAKD